MTLYSHFGAAPKLVVALLVILVTLIGIEAQTSKFSPGLACTGNSDCANIFTNYLECDLSTKTCQCTDPVISQFDYFNGICYRKLGSQCPPAPPSPPIPPPTLCPPKSACAASGVCQCDSTFTPTVNQKCVKLLGEPCTVSDDQCDHHGFQICRNNVCGCKGSLAGDAIFDPATQKCILKVGKDCTIEPAYVGGPVQPCEKGSACTLGKCRCLWPMEENAHGQCRVSFNGSCDDDLYKCNELKFMTCGRSSGRCECDETTHKTFYDQEEDECLILAGQDCNEVVSTGQSCVENSECRLSNSSPGAGNWYCTCMPAYQETPVTHKCYLPHGQPCVSTPPDGDKCNFEAFQECGSAGFCECANLTHVWYDATTTTCYLLEDASCIVPGDDNSHAQSCAPNSHCAQSNFGGICLCDTGLQANAERKCRLRVHDFCSPLNDLCDDSSFLQCNPQSGQCDCANPAQTNMEDGNVCRLRAGTSCSPLAQKQECTEFAQCLLYGASDYQCFCEDDLSANNLGQCVRHFLQPCGDDLLNGPCDPESFLSCHSIEGVNEATLDLPAANKYCQCLDPFAMGYDEESKKCFLKLSTSCSSSASLNGSIECQKNTVCDPVSGQCLCDSSLGWTLSDDGDGGATCVRKYGNYCDALDGINGGCQTTDFLECIDNLCQCNTNFSPIHDYVGGTTRCVGNFGTTCSKHEDCNAVGASLGCIGGKCACFRESEQDYDIIDEKCFTVFGGRCNISTLPEGDVPLVCMSPYTCNELSDSAITQMGQCGCRQIQFPGSKMDATGENNEKYGEKCTSGATPAPAPNFKLFNGHFLSFVIMIKFYFWQ